MNPEASKYLAKIGAKGGKAKSAAKTAAARKANAARWHNHKPIWSVGVAMRSNEKS